MAKRTDDVMFLKGKRLYLRPPTKNDIPCLLRWMNDQKVIQYLATYLPMTEADEIEWLDRLQKNKDKDLVFLMVDKKNGKPIGVMGIHKISWKDRTATTGAAIGEKKFWDKGYGTEAKMLLLNYAFNTLNLRKICSLAHGTNKRSVAYSKKCGYKVEGVRRKQVLKNGRYLDLIDMAVFKKDWTPLWKKFQKAGNV